MAPPATTHSIRRRIMTDPCSIVPYIAVRRSK
jgi:hypothetical protein